MESRKRPTLKDITKDDIRLMTKAYGMPEDHWMCFGRCYSKLESLGLVYENRLTLTGKRFLYELQEG